MDLIIPAQSHSSLLLDQIYSRHLFCRFLFPGPPCLPQSIASFLCDASDLAPLAPPPRRAHGPFPPQLSLNSLISHLAPYAYPQAPFGLETTAVVVSYLWPLLDIRLSPSKTENLLYIARCQSCSFNLPRISSRATASCKHPLKRHNI